MEKKSLFSRLSPKKLTNKLIKDIKIILKKDIDTSTDEGRKQKREQAIALTSGIAMMGFSIYFNITFGIMSLLIMLYCGRLYYEVDNYLC